MSEIGEQARAPRLRGRMEKWTEHLRRREDQLLPLLTLVIGAIVGLTVVAFILLTERLGARLYPVGGAAWKRVLIPVLGALGSGYFLYRYFPDARGSGVPQTKAALFAHEGRITLGTTLGKFFCTSASLATGIPLGREGPAVQVGAGICSVVGRALGLRQEKVKALIPAGASAAIAAAFNTPMAAVLFALEEVMGDLHAPVVGGVVLSAATSWVVLRLLLGNEPLFHVPRYQLVHQVEFGVYAVLGVLGGLVSVAFAKLLLWMRQRFLRLSAWSSWFQPVAGGLLVGLLGWHFPQVMGVGYAYVGEALNGRMAVQLLALLVVLKLLATTTSYASGNAGGIFSPSLFIGAMLGGTVGNVAHIILPAYIATPGAYALVGMGATFAGIVRVPMTSVIMIFELTQDYAIIVPLMISNLISFFISYRLQRLSLYDALARQDGIHLPAARTGGTGERGLQISRAMRPPAEVFPPHLSVAQALERARHSEFHAWPVTNGTVVSGLVALAALERAIAQGAGDKPLTEILDPQVFPHVHSDQPLDSALERMGAAGVDVLPVVSRANLHQLEGVVLLRDILNAYGVGEQRSSK